MGATGAIALAGCAVGSDDDDGNGDGGGGDGGDTNGGDGGGDDGGSTSSNDLGTLTVGIMQDYSGPLPDYGAQGTAGFYSGLAYKADNDPLSADAVDEGDYEYSVGDLDIELLARDTQFDAQQAQTLASDLVTDDEVDVLFGVGNSAGALRVITQVVDRSDVPYIAGPAASAEITNDSETCREQVFRANENTAMDARSGGVYIAEETDIDRMALFGADDPFGRSVVNNYRAVLEDGGVEIVEERFVPSGFQEWGRILEGAQDSGAQGIVGGFTASTLIPFGTEFLTGGYDMQLFGGFASRVTLAPVGSTLSETLGSEFTNEGIANAQFGPFTTRYHWNQYDNEINNQFVENHAATYDVVPDLFTSGAFTAASAVVQAVESEGEVSRDAIVSGMRGMTVDDTPKGEGAYTFQEYNNQARSQMTVANVEVTPDDQENWPAPIMPSDPVETVPAEDVTIPASDVSCDLS